MRLRQQARKWNNKANPRRMRRLPTQQARLDRGRKHGGRCSKHGHHLAMIRGSKLSGVVRANSGSQRGGIHPQHRSGREILVLVARTDEKTRTAAVTNNSALMPKRAVLRPFGTETQLMLKDTIALEEHAQDSRLGWMRYRGTSHLNVALGYSPSCGGVGMTGRLEDRKDGSTSALESRKNHCVPKIL